MRQKRVLLLIIGILMINVGCGLQKPTSGYLGTDIKSAVEDLSAQLYSELKNNNRQNDIIVIYDFTDADAVDTNRSITKFSLFIVDELTIKMARLKAQVADRDAIKQVMKEERLIYSYVSLEKLKTLKNVQGAAIVCYGNYTIIGDIVKINARLVDVNTGVMVGSGEVSLTMTEDIKKKIESGEGILMETGSVRVKTDQEGKLYIDNKYYCDLRKNAEVVISKLQTGEYRFELRNAQGDTLLSEQDTVVKDRETAVDLTTETVTVYNYDDSDDDDDDESDDDDSDDDDDDLSDDESDDDDDESDDDDQDDESDDDDVKYIDLGNEHYYAKEYEAAIEDYSVAIDYDPNSSIAYYNRGSAYNSLGKYDTAIADYNKAISITPDYADAYNNRGFAYNSLEQYDEAIADYNKAIRLGPDYTYAYNNRGLLHIGNLGKYDEAIADYNKAISLDPDNSSAYNNRGFAYNSLEQDDKAIADCNKAISLDPDNSSAYNNRGFAYNSLEQYDKAIADYNQAISLDPDYAIAYYNRGFAYKNKGDMDAAKLDWQKAKELGDKDAESQLKKYFP